MSVSLEKEYEMLVGELRQNRMIQLQTFLATPIWVSLFIGLLGTEAHRELFLLPVVFIYICFLLILDRRKSSDIIIAYLRTAIDQEMAVKPGWNHLLPEFRETLKGLGKTRLRQGRIPQRIDFNVLVWLSYLAVSLICIVLYAQGATVHNGFVAIAMLLTLAAYSIMLIRMAYQSAKKDKYLQAWAIVLQQRL